MNDGATPHTAHITHRDNHMMTPRTMMQERGSLAYKKLVFSRHRIVGWTIPFTRHILYMVVFYCWYIKPLSRSGTNKWTAAGITTHTAMVARSLQGCSLNAAKCPSQFHPPTVGNVMLDVESIRWCYRAEYIETYNLFYKACLTMNFIQINFNLKTHIAPILYICILFHLKHFDLKKCLYM